MNFHDKVPIELSHFLERNIAKNTSVVDHDIDSAESIDSSLNDLVTELDRILVCDGLATGSLDLINNSISGVLGSLLTFALNRATEIVDDNLGATAGKKKSILAAKTISSTCNDSHLSGEADITHLIEDFFLCF